MSQLIEDLGDNAVLESAIVNPVLEDSSENSNYVTRSGRVVKPVIRMNL